jgi:hypothetical protein
VRFNGHHVWCNYYIGPVENCSQCKRLDELYPDTSLSPEELQKKHFPDAIARTTPSDSGEAK